MAFTCPILTIQRYGRACSQVDVPPTVIGTGSERSHTFRFDTGCDITMVSEDVATLLGLPAGGTPVHVRGSTASGAGRLVTVVFRFPPDAVSGSPGPALCSMWVVVAGRTNVALLSFHEVHEHYFLGTDDTDMYFTNR
jgi:hypothetical protein